MLKPVRKWLNVKAWDLVNPEFDLIIDCSHYTVAAIIFLNV